MQIFVLQKFDTFDNFDNFVLPPKYKVLRESH